MNFNKSAVIFSKNVREEDRQHISHILGIDIVESHDYYLGLPAEWGRNKTQSLNFVKERLQKRVEGSKENLLTHGGKEVMLKSVVGAIPTYAMGIIRFPATICDEMEKIHNSFWWQSSKTNQGIHWLSWERMALPKRNGGIGFRSFNGI